MEEEAEQRARGWRASGRLFSGYNKGADTTTAAVVDMHKMKPVNSPAWNRFRLHKPLPTVLEVRDLALIRLFERLDTDICRSHSDLKHK